MSRIPLPPYPRGWFQAGYSDELSPGAVSSLSLFGRELVAFRSEDGRLSILDAHCPHLGAHMGKGGRVEGGCLRCPFHGWTFRPSGECADNKVRTRSWSVAESGGLVFVRHGEGASPAPVVPARDWTRYRWKVRTHVQEPLENVFDAAHFRELHGHHERPKQKVKVDGNRIEAESVEMMRVPGGKLAEGRIAFASSEPGVGFIKVSGLAETEIVVCPAPVDADTIELRFSFFSAGGPEGLGVAVIRDIVSQVEQDIPIWENKIYVEKPPLAPEESGILAFRRWFAQFY